MILSDFQGNILDNSFANPKFPPIANNAVIGQSPNSPPTGTGQQWMWRTANATLGTLSIQNAVNGVWLSYPGATNPDQLSSFVGATTQLSQSQALAFRLFCSDTENSTYIAERESGFMLTSWPAEIGSPTTPVTYDGGALRPEQLWTFEYQPSA
ncbi:hypothetical protein MVEN_01655500 [Mycena venus]|uniref:Uncharacterized protein n=1 Tax=Mycena venus TaxID=2733690 RepID=A0A8H6XRC3_9AGAR|nr:hypothetical protein MVEN_01655500 [Mycena venus]